MIKDSQWYKTYMGPEKVLLDNTVTDGIILGSTYSYWGFMTFSSEANILNAALPAQTLSYDERILRNKIKRIRKHGIVIITIMPGSFLVDEYTDMSRSVRYYSILDKSCIPGWSFKRKLRSSLLPVARRLSRKNPMPVMRNMDIKQTGCSRIKDWCREFGIEKLEDAPESPILKEKMKKCIDCVNRIVEMCNQNGLRHMIILMPVSETMRNMIPADYYDRCVVENVKSINGCGKIVDLYHEDDFCSDDLYFTSDCLNEKGQRKMADKMREIITEENIMEDYMVELSNGYSIPWISYGTGVVKRYYRNKLLYIKDNIRPILGTIKNRSLSKKLVMDKHGAEKICNAYNFGYRMFDSGRIYGHSEAVIGEGLTHKNRRNYYLTTKISDMDIYRKCSPNTVKGNLELSLKYLQTDYIDAYLLHWPHGDWIDIYSQMEDIYTSGLAKSIGVCNFKMEHFEELLKSCKVTPHLCQTELHPLNSKKDLRKYCREKGIIVMAHTPTGRMSPKIRNNSVLKDLANKHNKSIAQIILRWHFQNNVIPVVATVSENHMKENLDIFDFELSLDEMNMIESINEDYVMLDSDGIDNPNYIYNL